MSRVNPQIRRWLMEDMRTCLSMHPDVPPEEKADLQQWVKDGNSPWDNPSCIYDDRGCPMDFVEGTRIEKEMMHDFERDPAIFLTQWGISETDVDVIEPEG